MDGSIPCTPAADYRGDGPRADGWTPERQALFLVSLADTGLVSEACKAAGMSASSAYALRRSSRGFPFALGWKAAHLLARDLIADMLLGAALAGVETVTTREEGVTRRRTVNSGLSLAVLKRLDQQAAALDNDEAAIARSIGSAFDEYVELIRKGATTEDVASFLSCVPDPLVLAADMARSRTQADGFADDFADDVRELVEESAIYARGEAGGHGQGAHRPGHPPRPGPHSSGAGVHSGYF